jgi:type IV pilus assembly protein PilE
MNPAWALQRPARGFTLVEMLVVGLVLVALAAVALPAFKQHTLRAGRLDAVGALMKVQAAQEQHRSLHGLYADELSALKGTAAFSAQGLYAVTLARTAPEAYQATATARGRQADDKTCKALTLTVQQGFPTEGPTPECWQR